jgi:hypothetical protein
MDFNIVLLDGGANPTPSLVLNQTTDLIQKSLSLCGHTTRISYSQFDKNCINLIFDNNYNKDFIRYIVDLKRHENIKLGLYFGELYVNRHIPYALDGLADPRADLSTTLQLLRDRSEYTYYLASNVDFCWSAFERNAQEFQKYNAASFFFPNCHTQRIDPALRRSVKDIDVLFLGTATAHRSQWVTFIEESGIAIKVYGKLFPNGFLPGALPGSTLNRTKIALNLSFANKIDPITHADIRFASCDRLLQFLERDICVVSEHIPFDNPYADFTINGATNELAEICRGLLISGEWESKGLDLAAKFRREFSAERLIAPIVTQTLNAIFGNRIPHSH